MKMSEEYGLNCIGENDDEDEDDDDEGNTMAPPTLAPEEIIEEEGLVEMLPEQEAPMTHEVILARCRA
jgi:hypothetical protein